MGTEPLVQRLDMAALRIRVSKSAMGSVILMRDNPSYQLALITPGISPRRAYILRHTRHMRNRR